MDTLHEAQQTCKFCKGGTWDDRSRNVHTAELEGGLDVATDISTSLRAPS